jgi:hypothetical protein
MINQHYISESYTTSFYKIVCLAACCTLAIVLHSCSDNSGGGSVQVDPDPEMRVSVDAPDSVNAGQSYSVDLTGEDADGDVEVEYVLKRPELADSVVSRSISAPTGQFTDSFDVITSKGGEHEVSFVISDSDDEVNGSRTITVNALEDSTMSVTVDTPTTVQSNGPYTVTFTVSAADGPVSAEYSLSRPGVADSTVNRSLEPTAGAFTDVFSVSSQIVGQHELTYSFSDGDDEITGTASITVAPPDDNISSIEIKGPQGELYTNTQLDFRFLGEDEDGIDTAIIREEFNGVADSTTYESIDANSFDQSISRTFSQPGTYQTSLEIIDAFGRSIRGEQSFEIINEPDSPASITLTTPSGRGAQTWSLSATDADGWAQAVLTFEINGNQQSILVDISGSTLTATTTSPEKPGDYQITLDATDNLGNNYSESSSAQILAELTERQITLETGFEGIDVNIQFGFNGQNPSGVTDENGSWSTNVTAPADSLVEFSAGADAVGLVGASRQESSLADTTIQLTPDIVPIIFSGAFKELRPRSDKTVDLSGFAQAIDDGETIITQLDLDYSGVNLLVELIEGSTYRITTSDEDPAGVTESLTVTASHPFAQAQQTYDQRITERADIVFLQTSFNTIEKDSLVIADLRNILESSSDITKADIVNPSSGLTVRKEGDWTWVLKPENAETYSFSITAENQEGQQESEPANLFVDALPKANITVINSVTDQPVESYLLFLDTNDTVIDSLVSTSGSFSASIPQNATGLSVAELDNGLIKSFEHYISIDSNLELTRTLAVEDFREYDINRQYVGDLSLFDMKRFKHLVELVHGRASIINLNGGSQGPFPGILHRAIESRNGIGYDKLIVPDTTDWVTFGEIGIMEIGTPELIQNEYETKIAPIMGDFAPPVERRDKIVYINNEQVANVAYINPRLLPDSFGSNVVFGKLPYVNQQSLAQILSDGQRKVLSDEAKKRTALQELTAGNIYYSQLQADFGGSQGIPSEYQLGPDESIIHNSTTLLDLSKFDKKAGWMIYEPHHVPGEKIEHILRVPNALKQEYDAL